MSRNADKRRDDKYRRSWIYQLRPRRVALQSLSVFAVGCAEATLPISTHHRDTRHHGAHATAALDVDAVGTALRHQLMCQVAIGLANGTATR